MHCAHFWSFWKVASYLTPLKSLPSICKVMLHILRGERKRGRKRQDTYSIIGIETQVQKHFQVSQGTGSFSHHLPAPNFSTQSDNVGTYLQNVPESLKYSLLKSPLCFFLTFSFVLRYSRLTML